MKKTFSPKKSAFSLIELSIVLIIIGLLIAGVTGGASLIKSSELRAAISEARAWSSSVNAFHNQFNAFPGDYTVGIGGGASAVYGNGNSQINAFTLQNNPSGTASAVTGCATSPTVPCAYEDSVAWVQLVSGSFVDTNIVSSAANGMNGAAWGITKDGIFGKTNPASKVKSSGWVFDYNTSTTQNVVVLTKTITSALPTTGGTTNTNTFVNGTLVSVATLSGTDALSIDTKIDDGVSNAGRVRGVLSGCVSSAAYVTSGGNSLVCALSYQVDVNS
ncbi:MAG: prepilin-type N-terminal cleavage/methylation domain-containing protein [Alphaproteobacteria bacterium]|nr:prepilin-type N-terminal cleavage/methylation domain-containing protein [Alphaproteobacteria bacterium]